MRYTSAAALEMAVKSAASASPMDTGRAVSAFCFHRLLCRVFAGGNGSFVLKGGRAMLARTVDARATRDIDLLSTEGSLEDALEELVNLLLGNLGTHAVDHGHDDAVELDVDAGEPVVKHHEVGRDPRLLERVDQVLPREARGDAKGNIEHLELVEEGGDVDAVPTTVDLLARRTVGEAHVERQGMHDVVDGRVQRDGINQLELLSPKYALT